MGLCLFVGGSLFFGRSASADSFSSLSDDAKQHFINDGFSENDDFIVKTEVQQNHMTRAINVITMVASTKRSSSTMGYTSYYITSGKPILVANTVLNYGSYNSTSKVNVYGSPTSYSGGIFFSYTGKSKYFSCRATSQVTTTMGATSVSCNVGGLTLGK